MFLQSATGIPQVSTAVSALIPIVKDLGLVAAIVVIGIFLAAGFLLEEKHGVLSRESLRILRLARFASLVWLVCSIGNVILEIANLLASSLSSAMDPTALRSFLTQTALGKSYFIQICVAALLCMVTGRIRKVGGANLALVASLSALLMPVFQSHASSAGNHGIAIGSLLFHVGALSLWVGGVLALVLISPSQREKNIPRFSSLALWCAITVAISGSLNAWTRLNFWSAWKSMYAVIVLLKIFLTLILIVVGARHRKFIKSKLHGSRAIYQLLVNELAIMVILIALGGWLSTLVPPVSEATANLPVDPATNLTGLSMPAAPTVARILWGYVPDGTFLGLLILAVALYSVGIIKLGRRGDKWPVGRTVSFMLGIATADFATSGGLGIYSHFAFSYHMIAHMVLGMIAPIAFVLGAPITLALRTLPIGRTPEERGIRATMLAFLNSRYAKTITNPVVALGIFDGSLFLLYMTPLFGNLMQSHNGHLLMNVHFLASGFLFFHVIVGIDPNPQKVPHIVRIIILFAAMSIHAFFSIALMSATTLLDGGYFAQLHRPWNMNLLTDQHTGGSLGWAMGEIPILIALIATFIQWVRDDSREAKRIDRASDRALAMGDQDELAKYNQYLLQLSEQDRRHPDN